MICNDQFYVHNNNKHINPRKCYKRQLPTVHIITDGSSTNAPEAIEIIARIRDRNDTRFESPNITCGGVTTVALNL